MLKILLPLMIIGALAGGFYYWRTQSTTSGTTGTNTAKVTQGNIDVTVETSGSVAANKSADIPFQVAGRVKEILVKEGDQVKAGQPLARVDDRELVLKVQQAEADLKTAQATLDKARNGSATPQEIAQARAKLKANQANLEKARTGNVTAPMIREAEATVRAAQARLEALRNPSPDKVSTARLTLTQAETTLSRTRDELSAAKNNAQLEMEKAVSALTQAQSSYATAYENWKHVQDAGTDPLNPTTSGPDGETTDNDLSDGQRQQYYDAYVKAEAALRSAEDAVKQAQINYDTARQKEVVGVQEAEAKVEDARNQLQALMSPKSTDIVQAQAEVAKAQAQLDKLRQGGTRADIAAAQAQVEDASAALEQLTSPSDETDITTAEANVAQAQALVDAAKLALEQATVVAPFDGIVAVVSVTEGGLADTTSTAFVVVDTSSMHIDVDLSENDVSRVKKGQSVDISFDFDEMKGKVITGTVESVATTATEQDNVVTYKVRVRFEPNTDVIKVGMTATASILVERRENVIQVPSRAIQGSGPMKSVQVLYGDEKTPVTVHVETGLSNGSTTEIVQCIKTGNQCLRVGDEVLIDVPSGSSDGQREPENMEQLPVDPGSAPPGGAQFIPGG